MHNTVVRTSNSIPVVSGASPVSYAGKDTDFCTSRTTAGVRCKQTGLAWRTKDVLKRVYAHQNRFNYQR